MKLQKFLEYNSTDLEEEFQLWVSSKLGINIEKYLGGGVEGEIYAIDKFRAIKFGYANVSSSQHLSNRNLKGVMKIYQTGNIVVPKKFKGDPESYEYDGIQLLRNHDRGEYTIGYIIMERLNTPLELENKLEIIDSYLWRDFVKMRWEKGDNGQQNRIVDTEGYHEVTKKIIEESLNGFGSFILKSLFKNINEKEYIQDIEDCIHNAEFEVPMKIPVMDERGYYVKHRPVTYSMKDPKFKKEILELFNDLVVCFKNIKSVGMNWGDIHHQQFGYNSKGELAAFDISFDTGVWDNDTKTLTYGEEELMSNKRKVKNVIREFKDFN